MADKAATIDVIMTFIQTSGTPIDTEASTDWDKSDNLMRDFDKKVGAFDVEDWGFNAELSDSDNRSGSRTNAIATHGSGRRDDGNANRNDPPRVKSGAFAGYIDSGDASQYPSDLKEITVTKQVEWSSMTLLDHCLHQIKFLKAIIVKRKFTGDKQYPYQPFLRMEFKDPLVIRVEWDEGEVLKEKITFICRGIKFEYKQQLDDGTLNQSGPIPIEWEPQRKLASSK